MRIGIDDASLGAAQDVVLIQSWSLVEGLIEFGVLAAADKQPLTANHTFTTLLEALVMTDVFLRQLIDGLRQKRMAASAKTGANSNGLEALSDTDIRYVRNFARDLGNIAGMQGFAEFTEVSAGVMSIALGVTKKDTTIMLGTVAVVSKGGESSCTVRDFENRPMPGLENYRTIYSALTTTRSSFEKLAQLTAKHTRPSLMQRLFG